MSETVAGSLRVRILPDATGFSEEAARQVNAQNMDEAIAAAGLDEQKLKASQVALAEIEKKLKLIAQMKALSTDAEVFARSIYAQDLPALEARSKELQRQIIIERELAAISRARVRESVRASLQPVAPPTGPGGRGGVGEFLKHATSGREGGLGGIISMTSRLGLMGFAAATAFSAVSELQNALKVTGDEAFTSTGRIRNFGAELIGGNIIGGIKALFAIRQARLLGDLPQQIQALKDKTDPLAITEEKLIDIRSRGADALKNYLIRLELTGHISDKTAKDLAKVTEELFKQTKATEASGDALLDFSRKLEQQGKDTLKRGVGPGALFQRTGIPANQAFGSPKEAREAGAANLQVMAAMRASVTSRIQNDRERAKQELVDAKINAEVARTAAMQAHDTAATGAAKAALIQAETAVLEKTRALRRLTEEQRQSSQERNNQIASAQAALIRDNVARANADLEIAKTIRDQAKTTLEGAKGVQEINAAWTAYRLAVIGVSSAQQAAKDAVDQAAADAQALGDSVRESIASRIPDDEARQQALLKAAKTEQKNARAAFEAKRHTTEANDLWDAYVAAKTKTILIEQGIKDAAKAAADAAAESAKNAREAQLQNDITAAELSGDKPRIKRAYAAAISYWQAIADGTKATSEAHQDAVAQILQLTQAQAGAINTDALREARLRNELALAELKGLDTKPILVAMVKFAFEAMKNAKAGTDAFEQARGAWIAARQNLATSNQTLNELKRANARARAALTEGEADDEKLLRAEIRRLNKKVATTKGMGIVHQKAIAELLAAERELAGMVEEIKPTTTVFDLLTKSTQAFAQHAGNLINNTNRFSSDLFTSGLRGQIGSTPNAAGRARLQIDDANITRSLNENTGELRRNTIALNNAWAAFGRGTGVGPNLPAGEGPVIRNNASVGNWLEARASWRARAGIS